MNANSPAAFATYAGIYAGHWFFLALLYALWRLKAGLLWLLGSNAMQHRKHAGQAL